MSFFIRNLPYDILMYVFEFDDYKRKFSTVISNNALLDNLQQRFIKNIKDNDIKCLYNHIARENLLCFKFQENYTDLKLIVYIKSFEFYEVFYNAKLKYKFFIFEENKHLESFFTYYSKNYNHYLIIWHPNGCEISNNVHYNKSRCNAKPCYIDEKRNYNNMIRFNQDYFYNFRFMDDDDYDEFDIKLRQAFYNDIRVFK